ncbi:loricrin-like [Ischnura elegans]|uniref:loricrin-like n=1 Tax=Ischnura elegans TaxID=197161 RepID=UPI001ED86CE6|nr:loricrin-like [Ischnura elegans]
MSGEDRSGGAGREGGGGDEMGGGPCHAQSESSIAKSRSYCDRSFALWYLDERRERGGVEEGSGVGGLEGAGGGENGGASDGLLSTADGPVEFGRIISRSGGGGGWGGGKRGEEEKCGWLKRGGKAITETGLDYFRRNGLGGGGDNCLTPPGIDASTCSPARLSRD